MRTITLTFIHLMLGAIAALAQNPENPGIDDPTTTTQKASDATLVGAPAVSLNPSTVFANDSVTASVNTPTVAPGSTRLVTAHTFPPDMPDTFSQPTPHTPTVAFQYRWTLPDGTTTTTANSSISFNASQSGNVKCTVLASTQDPIVGVTPLLLVASSAELKVLKTQITGPNNMVFLKNPGGSPAADKMKAAYSASAEPAGGKYEWSVVSGDIVIQGNAKDPQVQVKTKGESDAILRVKYTVNGQTSTAEKTIHIKHPAKYVHGPISTTRVEVASGGKKVVYTSGSFMSTLLDQDGDPMPGVLINEGQIIDQQATTPDFFTSISKGPGNAVTNSAGQNQDTFEVTVNEAAGLARNSHPVVVMRLTISAGGPKGVDTVTFRAAPAAISDTAQVPLE